MGVFGREPIGSVLVSVKTKRTVSDPMDLPHPMDTPRPTLLVNGPYRTRAKTMDIEARFKRILAYSKEEEAQIRRILASHRRRQTRKLGHRDEDPDPYDSSYIFYCLDGRREN